MREGREREAKEGSWEKGGARRVDGVLPLRCMLQRSKKARRGASRSRWGRVLTRKTEGGCERK